MRFNRILVSEEVFFCIADLLEYSMILLDMPVFGMDFFEILSGNLFKCFFVSLIFGTTIMICVEKGILFEDSDESNITEMKDLSFFPERILGYLFVLLRFIACKSIGLESEEKTYSSFHEEFHVVLRSKPTVS
jgi:hypothetical protein